MCASMVTMALLGLREAVGKRLDWSKLPSLVPTGGVGEVQGRYGPGTERDEFSPCVKARINELPENRRDGENKKRRK